LFDLAGVARDAACSTSRPALAIRPLQAAARVGPGGSVLATDISPRSSRSPPKRRGVLAHTNVDTRAMDGENLDLGDASFDVVMSRVGLIYFPDQQRALSEMRRVLVPGGRVAAIVYATADKNGFFSVPVSIVRRHAKLGAPLVGQPGPFSLGAEGVLEQAFTRAASVT